MQFFRKEISEFAKKHKENIAVVGGILEGKYLTFADEGLGESHRRKSCLGNWSTS